MKEQKNKVKLFTALHTVFTLSVAAASASVFAQGSMDSGGGPAVRCVGNGAKPYKEAKTYLMDLYEGSEHMGLTYERPTKLREGNESFDGKTHTRKPLVDHLIENAIRRLPPIQAFEVREILKEIREKRVEYVHPKYQLYKRFDLGEDAVLIDVESGCSPMWAALNERSEKVRIISRIYNEMPALDQAALFVHEAVYEFAKRMFRNKSSNQTRKLVALLFSKEHKPTKIRKFSAVS